MHFKKVITIVWPIILVAFVAKSKTQLKRISDEENERIQQFCQNPDFRNGVRVRGMVLGGRPLQPGEYPWAVVLFMSSPFLGMQPFCGGTLISQRHILTARHCIQRIQEVENVWGIKWWIEVGGVCAQVDIGDECQKKDMFDVPYALAIYASKGSKDEKVELNQMETRRKSQNDGIIAHSVTDFAIVQLATDLSVVPLKDEQQQQKSIPYSDDRVQVACLPHWESLSHIMHVYGWGNTERDMRKANSQDPEKRKNADSNPSAHLMETEMAVLGKEAIEWDAERKKKCDSDKLICLQSLESEQMKDGATGDSGSGIVGKRMEDGLAYVEALTIAGIPNQMINVGLTTHSIAREICFYTGVCLERFWVESGKNFETLTNDDSDPMIVMDQIYTKQQQQMG